MLATTAFYESGRRDLNATAPMRGRCFIGTYAHQRTALAAIGNYGPANTAANIFSECECSRRRGVRLRMEALTRLQVPHRQLRVATERQTLPRGNAKAAQQRAKPRIAAQRIDVPIRLQTQ